MLPTRKWWQTLLVCMEAYLVLAGITFWIWSASRADTDAAISLVFLGSAISLLGVLIGGVILLFRRQHDWGCVAIGFAVYGFLFCGYALARLARVQ